MSNAVNYSLNNTGAGQAGLNNLHNRQLVSYEEQDCDNNTNFLSSQNRSISASNVNIQ